MFHIEDINHEIFHYCCDSLIILKRVCQSNDYFITKYYYKDIELYTNKIKNEFVYNPSIDPITKERIHPLNKFLTHFFKVNKRLYIPHLTKSVYIGGERYLNLLKRYPEDYLLKDRTYHDQYNQCIHRIESECYRYYCSRCKINYNKINPCINNNHHFSCKNNNQCQYCHLTYPTQCNQHDFSFDHLCGIDCCTYCGIYQ